MFQTPPQIFRKFSVYFPNVSSLLVSPSPDEETFQPSHMLQFIPYTHFEQQFSNNFMRFFWMRRPKKGGERWNPFLITSNK